MYPLIFLYVMYLIIYFQVIENDYVEMRKSDVKNMSPDDLNHYIMLSKYVIKLLIKI